MEHGCRQHWQHSPYSHPRKSWQKVMKPSLPMAIPSPPPHPTCPWQNRTLWCLSNEDFFFSKPADTAGLDGKGRQAAHQPSEEHHFSALRPCATKAGLLGQWGSSCSLHICRAPWQDGHQPLLPHMSEGAGTLALWSGKVVGHALRANQLKPRAGSRNHKDSWKSRKQLTGFIPLPFSCSNQLYEASTHSTSVVLGRCNTQFQRVCPTVPHEQPQPPPTAAGTRAPCWGKQCLLLLLFFMSFFPNDANLYLLIYIKFI